MSQKLSSEERLKSRKVIERIFLEGRAVTAHPLKLVYIPDPSNGNTQRVAFSVGKRHFKKAVDRNRIKRLLREVYRTNKELYFNNISTPYALMILYIGNTIPNYNEVESACKVLFDKFALQLTKEDR